MGLPAFMHIADITMFWSPCGGGVSRYLRQKRKYFLQHHRLSEHRHAIWVPGRIAPQQSSVSNDRDSDFFFDSPIPEPSLPLGHGYRLPLNLRAARRLLIESRPDIIESADPYQLAWVALSAARALHCPTVAFCHSYIPDLFAHSLGAWSRVPVERYLRHLYQRFDIVLAPSAAIADRLDALGVKHVSVQALGVDTECFKPRQRVEHWWRRHGISAHAKVMLYAGRMATEKNLDTLCRAVDWLPDEWILVLIGNGPCAIHGARVIHLPYQTCPAQLAEAICHADVVVHAGDQETFGLAVLEALACGAPVVARAAGGLAELVDDSVGQTVRSNDPLAFARAIEQVAAAGRTRYGAAARRRAAAYDWTTVFSQMFARYTALLGGRSATNSNHCPDGSGDDRTVLHQA